MILIINKYIMQTMPYKASEEEMLISCLIQNEKNDCKLKPYMFSVWKYKLLFELMVKMQEWTAEILMGQLDWIIEISEFAELMIASPTSSHLKYYEKIVYEAWQLRAYITISDEIMKNAYNYNIELSEKNIKRFSKIMPYKEDEAELEYKKPFTWGTRELDKTISPIEQHHMLVLAGFTGCWKTVYTFDMAIKNAELWHKVLYISLEMNTEAIIKRTARDYAGIKKYDWRNRGDDLINLDTVKKWAYFRKIKELNNIKWFIPIGLNNPEIENILKEIDNHKPDLVFIDNIWEIKTGWDLKDEINISQKVQNYSKYNNVPILLLHHFKKNPKWWKEKLRNMDDLRGSSAFANWCTTAIQVWRDVDVNDWLMTVIQMKDREFWIWWRLDIKFNKWTFEDLSYWEGWEEPDFLNNKN